MTNGSGPHHGADAKKTGRRRKRAAATKKAQTAADLARATLVAGLKGKPGPAS